MKITSHIHAVRIPFRIPIAPGKTLDRFVYAYIVCGRDEVCLIDSGVAGSESIIFEQLAQLGKKPGDITQLILTHAHPDHIGAAKAVRGMSGCRISAHAEAREWIEDIDKQFNDRPVPGFHTLVGGSAPVDRLLADNDNIVLGDTTLKVIHTPGHSRCSISLFCKEQGVLFSGDAIPQGNDLPIYDDAALAVRSIRKLQQVTGIKQLLASWSDPDPDTDPYRTMENGVGYFQKIHAAMRTVPDIRSYTDPMQLCSRMVEQLGLPDVAVNPLIARSFSSHLRLIDHEEI